MNIIKKYLLLALISLLHLPLFADNNSVNSITLARIVFEELSMPSAIFVGEALPCDFRIYNGTLQKIKDYTVNFYLNDEVVSTYSGENLASGNGYNVSIIIPIPETFKKGQYEFTIGFTKVNGETLETVYKSSKRRTVSIVAEKLPRVGVMEEITARWCGWCPRGHVGIEKLQNKFKDSFIGITIHGYKDPMYYPNYPIKGLTSYPSCVLNRTGHSMDPYYGTASGIVDDFEKVMKVPATVTVTLDATYNNDSSYIDAVAQIKSLINAEDYSIVFVVTGDDMYHDSQIWKQANYYARYSPSSVPADLKQFAYGEKYGQNPFDYHYNNVVIASSYSDRRINQATLDKLTEDGTTEAHYSIKMPTETTLTKGIKYDHVYVNALVINGNGEIANAAKVHVTSNTTGIESLSKASDAQEVVARYGIDGSRVEDSHKGLQLLKMNDGTVKKVMVK